MQKQKRTDSKIQNKNIQRPSERTPKTWDISEPDKAVLLPQRPRKIPMIEPAIKAQYLMSPYNLKEASHAHHKMNVIIAAVLVISFFVGVCVLGYFFYK